MIIETGEGVTAEEPAMKAEMSAATVGHCLEAFKGVCQALRDAKLLPVKRTPDKAPTASEPAVVAK